MIVLDASALLAFLFREPGHEVVAASLDGSCISAVNLAEVLGRFAREGHDPELVLERIGATEIDIVPFLAEDAAEVAALVPPTLARGLSLGDRACLALARSRGIPALTADREWAGLAVGVDVRLVR